MKWALLFTFIITSITSYAQVPLGIGMVSLQFTDTTTLNLYTALTDNKPVKTIHFYYDEVEGDVRIRDMKKDTSWLKPELYDPEDSTLLFRCKSQGAEGYEVIVNKKTGSALWVKKNAVDYYDWLSFLQEIGCIEMRDDKPQTLQSAPDDKATPMHYDEDDYDCMEVKSMQGDWIQVTLSDSNGDPGQHSKFKPCWIRWRKGNELLIEY